jgi:tetratricopeptide (TPR) repeat protein
MDGVGQIIVDLSPTSRGGKSSMAAITAWRAGSGQPEASVGQELMWPLGDDDHEDLRWYLEEYLTVPFGVYGQRGPQIEAKLGKWGEEIFTALFPPGPARDTYLRTTSDGQVATIVFRSRTAELLGLPWELMREPGHPRPVALDLAGLGRTISTDHSHPADWRIDAPGERVRVLMVISRPKGRQDIGYQMVARPLLRRLEAVRGQVDLVLLRPATLDALAETLRQGRDQGAPFQVVHFDGHGAFDESAGESLLAFERAVGGSDLVPTSRVAQVLATARVPVVVLNACQSGAIGSDLSAAIATRLLQDGTESVVAMAYTVYAVAAAEFMAAFYERLFAGDPVSAAVRAGRQRMFTSNERPSPKGNMPLADWVIPVNYQRRDVSFPQARRARERDAPSLDDSLNRLRAANTAPTDAAGDLDGVGTFIGRDVLYYELEAAVHQRRTVLLHGPAGTGKTELAKAFGRWRRDTGGVEQPDYVFWHTFESGSSASCVDGVVSEIGIRVFGVDFIRLVPADRRARVESFLAAHQALLIWDNFETVHSMPGQALADVTPNPRDSLELRTFLSRVTRPGAQSAVLITSRSTEDWLGGAVSRTAVPGLSPREADEYATYLLESSPTAQRRRADRGYVDLMEWLDGHPLSMRLVLPHLKQRTPHDLLNALHGVTTLPGEPGGDPATSLSASIAYSYGQLPGGTRRLLMAVALFRGVVDEAALGMFSTAPYVPDRFAHVPKDAWRHALEAAAAVGLLTPVSSGASIYRIHPALPVHLAGQWRAGDPVGYDREVLAATRALCTTFSEIALWLYDEIRRRDTAFGNAIIGMYRYTLAASLGFAIDHHLWEEAVPLIQALTLFWTAVGLTGEVDAWAERARAATEDADGMTPDLSTAAGTLWLHVANTQARRFAEGRQFDKAEPLYGKILAGLEVPNVAEAQKQMLGTIYHQVGIVAHMQGRLDEAEQRYRKSIAVKKELDDQRGIAMTYHQLGMLADFRGQLNEAAMWYQKLVDMNEHVSTSVLGGAYYQLGVIAHKQGHVGEAQNWCVQALAVSQRVGDLSGMARAFHLLGMIEESRRRPDDARDWYSRALAIQEKLGDQHALALLYHQLGSVAMLQRRGEEAAEWFRMALRSELALGDHSSAAVTMNELKRLVGEGTHLQTRRLVIGPRHR